MKPDLDGLTGDTIVDFIGSIFDRRGGEEYLGEPVTMGEHMLQGATLAERSGQSEEIIVAALLHDIGHFTSEFGTFTMDDTEDRHHEDAGAEVLERFFPTVVTDLEGRALSLCYSSVESISVAIRERRGVYWSRRRGLWRKGETSGDTQELVRVDVDCDRDALRFVVRPRTQAACHTGSWSCFGTPTGLAAMQAALTHRQNTPSPGSYTQRLWSDPSLLAAKITEEAAELAIASTRDEVCAEAADVLFFTAVRLRAAGLDLSDVARELERRTLLVERRPGDAKPNTQDSTGEESA